MAHPHKLLETVNFPHLTTHNTSKAFNVQFDIRADDAPDCKEYCQQLVNKVFALKHSEFCDFLTHHCNLAEDSMTWINKFEKLLTVNAELFDGKGAEMRLIKLISCLEGKRNSLKSKNENHGLFGLNKIHINALSEDRHFSFMETKQSVERMQSENAKILFLTSEVLEYQEADIIMHNKKLCDYDLSCEKLIKKIRTLSQLKSELQVEISNTHKPHVVKDKIRLHGPQNILTNAIKQMMFELKPTGHAYLQGKIGDMATFICDNFEDENGNSLSFDTIRTYLSPTRNDKNPNFENQVKF